MRIVPHSKNSVTCKVIKADEGWFKKRPQRHWRLRRFIAGEDGGLHDPPAPGSTAYVVVERLPSGGLMRRFVALRFFSRSTRRALDNDGAIKSIFLAWALATPDGSCVVDIPEGSALAARIRNLARTAAVDDEFAEQVSRMACPFAAEFADIVAAEARP